jgi:hypothetical protein
MNANVLAGTLARALFALALASGAGSVAFAEESEPRLVSYQKDSGIGLGAFGGKLLHSYGYKDKVLENGNWEVTGQARSNRPEDSRYIALYRAAEIAVAERKQFIRIVSVNGRNLSAVMAGATRDTAFSGSGISYGTRHVMEFQLSDTPDSEENCNDDVLRPTCRTIETAAIIEEIRPHLRIRERR